MWLLFWIIIFSIELILYSHFIMMIVTMKLLEFIGTY